MERGRKDREPWAQTGYILLTLWEETRGGEEKLGKIRRVNHKEATEEKEG